MFCFEFKVCSIEYFLDEMQTYEVNPIIENIPYLDRNSWEQNRFLAYTNIQMNTKKKLEPTDIIKFAWDKEENNTSITNEDIERLERESQLIFKAIQENG